MFLEKTAKLKLRAELKRRAILLLGGEKPQPTKNDTNSPKTKNGNQSMYPDYLLN